MAHPNKAEGIRGHNAKLRRMTRDYGDANPAMKREARVNFPKRDGAEEEPGFGSDSAGATPRSDRPAQRAAPGNAVATLRHGGKVRHRAAGGSVGKGRHKGKTNVSININPASGNTPIGPSMPPIGSVPPVMPPPRPPITPPPGAGMGPGAPAMPPGGPMPPPGMPSGAPPGPLGQLALQQKAAGLLPRKRGGRIPHDDEAADKKLVKNMVRESALKGRARGGNILKGKGAQSGEGRLNRNRAMGKLKPVTGVTG